MRRQITKIISLLAVATTFLVLLGSSVGAQQRSCATYDAAKKHLATNFSETSYSKGLAYNGNILEVFTSIENDTWTIILTTPKGYSCIFATGVGWAKSVPTKLGFKS